MRKRCAFCGNKEENGLFDEEKYYYCANCKMRTKKTTGRVYVVKCKCCGRKTCGGTISCMFCGEPFDPVEKPTRADRKSDRKCVDEYEKGLSPFSQRPNRFWRYSFRRRRLMRSIWAVIIIAIVACYFILM